MTAHGLNAIASTRSPPKTLARDVRAMPIKVVTVGKGTSKGAALLAEEWVEKVRRYTSVVEVQIKTNPKKSSSVEIQKQAEGEKVLKAIEGRDFVVVLDERGRAATSEDIANLIASAGDKGSPLVFCIGGPFGHSQDVKERGNDTIRLSAMVLNHQVAHIVLIEQLYRGWTILRASDAMNMASSAAGLVEFSDFELQGLKASKRRK